MPTSNTAAVDEEARFGVCEIGPGVRLGLQWDDEVTAKLTMYKLPEVEDSPVEDRLVDVLWEWFGGGITLTVSNGHSEMKSLAPDVIILDDVDRIPGFSRGEPGALRSLEERQIDIPLVLATCNDQSRLQDAFKRPGRIDEVLTFDRLDSQTRQRVGDKIAVQEGGELIPDRRDCFEELTRGFRRPRTGVTPAVSHRRR